MQLNELVNLHFDDLNESDLYIWNYINNHREVCTKITIEDLGKKCNVSRTTILRFSKKIGLEGFAELKYYLRNEQTLADVGLGKTVGSKTISITRINANSLSLLADEPIYIFFGDFPIVFETAYTSPTMFFALTELLFANYHNYQQKKLFQQGNQNYAE